MASMLHLTHLSVLVIASKDVSKVSRMSKARKGKNGRSHPIKAGQRELWKEHGRVGATSFWTDPLG